MRPATLLPPMFGPDSFARHRRGALAAGVMPVIWFSAEAGRDLDRPADLMPFLALNSATRAHFFLANLDLAARFEAIHLPERHPAMASV